MSIVNPVPTLRANYADTLAATPHLQEGKLATLNSAGEIVLATGQADALGVITSTDGQNIATCGCRPGGSITLRSFGGILEGLMGATASNLVAGAPLYFATGGLFTATKPTVADSDPAPVPVAVLAEPVAVATANQLVRIIFNH